jgi:hypothetical protein
MQQSLWEADRSTQIVKFTAFYGTRVFIDISLYPANSEVLCNISEETFFFFTVRSCQPLAQPPTWRTTSCRLTATVTVCSLYSQPVLHILLLADDQVLLSDSENNLRLEKYRYFYTLPLDVCEVNFVHTSCSVRSRTPLFFWSTRLSGYPSVDVIQNDW